MKPIADEINALPPRLRNYIHMLETDCDPSGNIREIIALRENEIYLIQRLKEFVMSDDKHYQGRHLPQVQAHPPAEVNVEYTPEELDALNKKYAKQHEDRIHQVGGPPLLDIHTVDFAEVEKNIRMKRQIVARSPPTKDPHD